MSNCAEVLNAVSSDHQGELVDLNESSSVKILGLYWQPQDDCFVYKINVKGNVECTKRTVLSEASRLFDPLGFLSPCVVVVKILFQELWIQQYDWDDQLPIPISEKWNKVRNDFIKLENIRIPRWVGICGENIELIGFCDASESAYSAVIYVKTVSNENSAKVNLLVAKTKVAPIKKLSIPRLELCGAWLLTKLYAFVLQSMNLDGVKMTAFSDSSVVLSWLSSHPHRWKPYVANRIANIIEVLPACLWRHVGSKSNPADCASRGISPESLIQHPLWWQGPSWLIKDSSNWPVSKLETDGHIVESEARSRNVQVFYRQTTNDTLEYLFNKFSSLTKICRIIVYCMRLKHKSTFKTNSFITAAELELALGVCIEWAQNQQFGEEISLLKRGESLPNKSKIKNLKPFLDEYGKLRVLGRLLNSNCNFDTKHPYILPTRHVLTKRIISLFHLKYLHAGSSLLTNILRLKFWIIGCRNMVKQCISNCVICIRQRGKTREQLMAQLPKERVTPNRPFNTTGIDYAGPFDIRLHKGRNPKTSKAYISVFVCFCTKAVHLELVSDMTSDAFVAALQRFIGRRGLPAKIQSDNGTNFVGAKRKIQSLYEAAFENKELVFNFLAENRISWSMIPPAAPHMGGIWESSVKSVKHHLKRVVGDHRLTFEEFSTLLIQIEAQLNSRPLTPIFDNDMENLDVLTPGHFLIGAPLIIMPEPSVLDQKLDVRNRWNLVTKMQQDFWKRWHLDYLNTLQTRKKWQTEHTNLKLGDIVLIKDNNLPPTVWALGRIHILHSGADGLVRVATLQTMKGYVKRPIVKLVKLPTELDDDCVKESIP